MICSRCGGETPEGKRFCKDCGAPLAALCPACGSEIIAGSRFCADCGEPLGEAPPAGRALAAPGGAAPGKPGAARTEDRSHPAELRHVSVLFCDLVGFTPLSESRDPAEMRELLSGYFEVARSVVGRYGGVIEKFIGDAVMAVWGVPVANEDDAERAVRAGLELLEGIAEYGGQIGLELSGRVGIVTGRTATSASETEGLVVGDRVNTAARIQSAAPPGTCYVDEITRAATSAAIAYEEAGSHELKGKAEPLLLFRALRVEAAVAGSQRSSVIEAPFTGREHELRLLKELLHASLERGSARLALVSGVAGIGKSRLGWELFKYVDGIAQELLWHSGRCLSYGDGVSYWALSEMVRARLQISEEDSPAVATERLQSGLERWIATPADREFIAPRLAQLLGLPTEQNLMRQELFAGWRLFFERLSEHLPVVMVVEDLQWADPGLVEFLDQLLDWSADHRIFLLVLTRPEGVEKAGPMLARRNTTNLSLDPLPDEAVGELLDSLVSDLPAEARARIIERAEGIPLYALETVRALIDRGVIARDDDGLRVAGEIGQLDVPPELTALISSRIDTLGQKERQLVKECAVLGDSFPRHAVEAVTDLAPNDIDEFLQALVRREVLTVRADKLSPERGQYAFTQSLIRQVAYEMLTGAERKARHLRTARHLQSAFGSEGTEVAEVIAAHLHDAYRAAGNDAEAAEIRIEAERAAVAAGERASSVGAHERAEVAYLRAAELAAEERARAGYLVQAARMANEYENSEAALASSMRARQLFEAMEDSAGVAAADLVRSIAVRNAGDLLGSVEILEAALRLIEGIETPATLKAELNAELGTNLTFIGQYEGAQRALDAALLLAQQHKMTNLLATAFSYRSAVHEAEGRTEECRIYLEASLKAVTEGSRAEIVVENNLGWFYAGQDIPGAEEHLRRALTIARRRGTRHGEAAVTDSLLVVLLTQGRFSEARVLLDEVNQQQSRYADAVQLRRALLEALCGNPTGAFEALSGIEGLKSSPELQVQTAYHATAAATYAAAGEPERALQAIEDFRAASAIENRLAGDALFQTVAVLTDAALDLGQPERAEPLLGELEARPVGNLAPSVLLQMRRARALLGSRERDDEQTERDLVAVEKGFAELGYEYWRARLALDLAELFARAGRNEEARVRASDAAASFARLGAVGLEGRAEKLAGSLGGLVTTPSAG